jgi:type VI secretion system protein ImpF
LAIMTDLSLRERLQPALFDRLIDEERLLTLYELTCDRAQLQKLGILERDLCGVLTAEGLTLVTPTSSDGDALERLTLCYSAPAGRVGLARIKQLMLKPPGAPGGVVLEEICGIQVRNVLNDTAETPEQRFAAGRRLRELVNRDLSLLLNACSMETLTDLDTLPHVRTSVLNFGMPSLIGKMASSVGHDQVARALETVIRRFEPRLTRVRVTPEPPDADAEIQEISFLVDAELWGQPAPHQVMLHTRIDTGSGKVRVSDRSGRW